MDEETFRERIKRYSSYLDREIVSHNAEASLESIAGAVAEEGHARTLQLARDKIYTIFPEMKPDGYKTVLELYKQRQSKF